jgi:hypothetical protein
MKTRPDETVLPLFDGQKARNRSDCAPWPNQHGRSAQRLFFFFFFFFFLSPKKQRAPARIMVLRRPLRWVSSHGTKGQMGKKMMGPQLRSCEKGSNRKNGTSQKKAGKECRRAKRGKGGPFPISSSHGLDRQPGQGRDPTCAGHNSPAWRRAPS